MARPGDDDFEWNDFDFSDFDDDFDELEEATNPETSDDEADNTEDEPLDGGNATHGSLAQATSTSPASGEKPKIPCDLCNREYATAGWLSRHKRESHGISSEGPSKANSDNTAQDNPEDKLQKKASQASKPRKIKVKRPTSTYTKEDALKDGPELLIQALEAAVKYPPWHVTIGTFKTPGNTAAQTAKELLDTLDISQHTQFVGNLCGLLWDVIVSGDRATLCSAAYEHMFRQYYLLCSGKIYIALWKDLMTSVCKTPCPLLHQFLTRQVFEGLLRKRHTVDAPISSEARVASTMTPEEEQVVRYIAGFIPFALLKKYRKLANNKVAQLYVHILQQWRVSSVDNRPSTFLLYTELWINEVSRGGLFMVKDEVYLFFRRVENVVRSTANLEQLRQGKLSGLRDEIIKNLESSYIVNKYWCDIATAHISNEKVSMALLEAVLHKYVNLRCRAFADAYILVQRRKNSDVGSKKGEKSLRKSL
uniref:C2H2-type domain-containing protein n=1 Tax=Branchiostoma floridae TaxID=7739 RepID=C3YB56_BRAFL|eukprot:XP_002606508.1 hypothetical protein BRAFLDRAFT_126441 [Branchiostoma floridae]